MTTKTYFRIQAHTYDGCDDPKNCTKRGHWHTVSDEEYKSYDEAQDAAEEDDAPYVRIFKETVTRELVGGRD